MGRRRRGEGQSRGHAAAAPVRRRRLWHIGKPDLVVKSVEHAFPQRVGLVGRLRRRHRAHRGSVSQGGRDEAVWAPKVVHHAVTYLMQDEGESGSDRPWRRAGRRGGGFLNEYAVGKNGDIFPEGTGRLVKAGAKVRFNMHYHSIGEETVDQTEVALVFYPKGYVPKYLHPGVPHGRLRGSRHSRRRRQRPVGRLHAVGQERAHYVVPAAHAQSRQGDVHGGDLS